MQSAITAEFTPSRTGEELKQSSWEWSTMGAVIGMYLAPITRGDRGFLNYIGNAAVNYNSVNPSPENTAKAQTGRAIVNGLVAAASLAGGYYLSSDSVDRKLNELEGKAEVPLNQAFEVRSAANDRDFFYALGGWLAASSALNALGIIT